MKKFLSLLLSALLVVSFAVPVSAAENVVDDRVQENAVAAYDELMGSFAATYSNSGEKIYPDYYGGSYINDAISSNFNEFGLYDSENRIIVKLDNLSDESIKEFKENVCDSDAIKFEQGCGPIKTEVNVNAGDKISYSGGSASIGYRVKRNGVVGFVTAGHAADSVGKSITYDGTAFASCKATQQSGNADAAFCEITNSNYSPTNTLSGASNTLSTTISEPGVGTVVNKIGMKTGHTSGKVLATNVTITFSSGALFLI